MTKEIKDYSKIIGSHLGVISLSTASYALNAMKEKQKRGEYKGLYSDDASFVRAAFSELQSFCDDYFLENHKFDDGIKLSADINH